MICVCQGARGSDLFLCNYWSMSNVLGVTTRLGGLGVGE